MITNPLCEQTVFQASQAGQHLNAFSLDWKFDVRKAAFSMWLPPLLDDACMDVRTVQEKTQDFSK